MKTMKFACYRPMKFVLCIFLVLFLATGSGFADDAETIEQLKKMVNDQQRQIDMLKEQLNSFEKKMTTVPVAATEPKRLVKSGKDTSVLKLYGQVNRGVLVSDDGENTDVFHVDNDNSSTRIGMTAEAPVTDDFKIGSKIEVQFESNSTVNVSQDNQNVGPNNFTERHLDLFFQSQKAGKLSVGQGDTASNGTSEVDLSGTAIVGYSDVALMAGGLQFVNSTTNALSGVTIVSAMPNMDGLSRKDRLRYDTPSLAGFVLSGSLVEDEKQDLAVRYSGKMNGTKFAAAAAYAHQADNTTAHQYNGSASLLLSSGLNFTLAGGARELDTPGRDDPFFCYGKVGYKADLTDLGGTNFAVDYGYFEDVIQDNDEAQTVGLFAVQEIDKAGVEIYLGFRWHELDRPTVPYEDIKAVLLGSRIKF